MNEPDDLARSVADERNGDRDFTLHVDFLAADEQRARAQAEQYVRALNYLRVEVDCFRAHVSSDRNWSTATAVFCGALGPGGTDVCLDLNGHPGLHHAPGETDRWP